jgi:hypothetical protein
MGASQVQQNSSTHRRHRHQARTVCVTFSNTAFGTYPNRLSAGKILSYRSNILGAENGSTSSIKVIFEGAAYRSYVVSARIVIRVFPDTPSDIYALP